MKERHDQRETVTSLEYQDRCKFSGGRASCCGILWNCVCVPQQGSIDSQQTPGPRRQAIQFRKAEGSIKVHILRRQVLREPSLRNSHLSVRLVICKDDQAHKWVTFSLRKLAWFCGKY